MTNSDEHDEKHARNRRERHDQIKAWAEYVRTHPDEDWGEQVNELVNAQLQSARHFEHDRPDMDELRDSSLLDGP
jgi:hypothetical protein